MVKKIFRSPITTAVLFLIAAGLILTGTIGGTRAALSIQSDDYLAEIQLDEIGVKLLENGESVPLVGGKATLLTNLVPEGSVILGKPYDELLSVQNNGDISEYVRVTVYKYWVDAKGDKLLDLDPSLIDLHFVTGEGWEALDADANNGSERTVLYYTPGPVAANGGRTSAFADTLTIASGASSAAYKNARIQIEAIVDGVQDHNGGSAMTSVWGWNYLGLSDE